MDDASAGGYSKGGGHGKETGYSEEGGYSEESGYGDQLRKRRSPPLEEHKDAGARARCMQVVEDDNVIPGKFNCAGIVGYHLNGTKDLRPRIEECPDGKIS